MRFIEKRRNNWSSSLTSFAMVSRIRRRFLKSYDRLGIAGIGCNDEKYSSVARSYGSSSRLTPREVTKILRVNEFSKQFEEVSSVESYETNQLASNNPVEDTRAEAKCLLTNGYLWGIFDGHGGCACAQVISKRLFRYIAAAILPQNVLKDYLDSGNVDESLNLLERYNDKVEFVSGIKKLYGESFVGFLEDLAKTKPVEFEMKIALENAFLRLDNDLSDEALCKLRTKDAARTLSVAMSGAVAVVAHIEGPNLHVAGVGDCRAVLGVHSETDGWSAKSMTVEHNTENRAEVERILSEHPASESRTVIKMERLLGQLAPLRSLGDFRYKWSKELINEVVVPYLGEAAIPPNYHTPPYLSARPEITYHRLRPSDKFLIIASDGLWDLMSPLEAVSLVAEHMTGKMTIGPLKLAEPNAKLSDIDRLLLKRKEGLRKRPLDSNAATHLLRNALGGTDRGIDDEKLSQFLTLPSDVVRVFRDDITITIVYTDTDYLEKCSVV